MAFTSQRLISLNSSLWIRNFVVILLVLGICLRFYNIGNKVYWHDETMTSLRISGYTQEEMVADAYTGSVTTVGDFLETYQYPSAVDGLSNTMSALKQHPEHSPMYYLMARAWMLNAPHTVVAIRLLSVLISLLTLPCMFWLCVELFKAPLVAWVSTALFSVAPFHLLYAQEAREYSLWTLAILLSSACCLWAIRINKPWTWLVYSLTSAFGLYVHPFSGFVLVSHGLHVIFHEGLALSRRTINYIAAALLSLLLFAPWMVVIITRFDQFVGNTASVNANRSGSMPLFWLLNLSRIFFDLNQGPSAINPAHYLLAALAIAALIFMWRRAPLSSALFITTLIGVTGLAIIGPDVLLGGRRSSITRYAVPCYLGLEIAIAYFLTVKLVERPFAVRARRRVRFRWRMVAITLAAGGILSCAVNAQVPVWWHKSYAKSRRIPDVAEVINQSDRPLIVSDRQPAGRLLSLSHELNPGVRLQLAEQAHQVNVPDGFDSVYLYLPSNRLRNRIERRQQIVSTPVTLSTNEQEDWLWATNKTEQS
ncbi:MAG: glycosyltransferase family 39 protein [Cyanobacteria bacterium J06633_2]